MMEYPKERVYMMRKRIEYLEQRRNEAERSCASSIKHIEKLGGMNQQLLSMHQEVDKLRQLIQFQLAPTNKIIYHMRSHIFDLYRELGHSEYSAWFSTYLNNQDWEGLAAFVGNHQKNGDKIFASDDTPSVKKNK